MYSTTQPCVSLQVHQLELTTALGMKLYNGPVQYPSTFQICFLTIIVFTALGHQNKYY